ncbi:Mak10 subunit, NatC N-terminal acetyltransferase-domain-containing protein [Boletus edulis BED1]|uniref:Mak10 subunit, NatC N-terminal acetyltransferase-domain-containing protein n=1 Tax=Boletus edulis BED1 TaxID=1328754 RepID=A0AAD4BQU6_BOLED|nr:Mak10 subunit, NatC N-terminal acetyltransferase-domain-containing protein [Boletus edulis BED1]
MDFQFGQVFPGDNNFYDVTQMFADAAADMPSGGLVLAKDFTLQDAMAAFEIGEPRFDSGLALMDQTRPVFDPLEPLLPEEVCWMIDRSFACEMQWHTGYTLSQTIFSFLHVHALRETDPELIPADQIGEVDHTRPLELVTIVLRASVYGLLKSCDLSWRELNKGNVYDTEDWQSEKCDVPLAEAIPVTYIQAELERACTWLDGSFQASSTWKDALRDRLVLRKTLIELLLAQLTKEYNRFPSLVNTARQLVQKIRQTPPPEPGPDSPASRAFDPQFARVLVSFIPLHDIQLPDQDTVWNKLVVLLDSLDQLSTLAGVSDLSTWKVIMGHVQSWLSKPDRRLAYIRSACQSTLFEDGLVFNKYTQKHVVDCFFMENCEISYDSFIDMVGRRWKGPQVSPLAHLERSIIELELGYIKALWYNPARRRRYCMKSLFDWHALYALLLDIKNNFEPWPNPDPLPRVCTTVLVRRLSVIREVIYSGTQLSLYSAEERVFAYWYASQVLDMQLSCMDELIPGLQGSPAFDEYQFQSIFLTALQAISLVVFSVSLKNLGTSWQRMRLNCIRRYKWAFIDEYDDIEQLSIGHPNFLKFTAACSAIQQDRDYSPVGQIRLAGVLLEELVTSSEGWTGPWVEERKQSIQRLRDVCQGLEKLPASMSEASVWDMSVLTWDPDVHPWFPYIPSH